MAVTFLQSQTTVGELINQELTDDTQTVTLTAVKRYLNFAYRKVFNAVTSVDPYWGGAIVTADIVADQSLYTLPTQCKKLIRLEIDYGGGTLYPAKLKSIQEMAITESMDSYATASPVVQTFGNYLILNPTPTTAVTGGLRFYYIKGVSDLTLDADTYNLPDGYDHLPTMYAVAKSKMTLGLENESKADLNEFFSEIAIMKTEMFNRVNSMGNDSVKFVDRY